MTLFQAGGRVVALGAMLLGGLQVRPQEATPNQLAVTLKLAVSLPDGSVFNIPAIGDGEMAAVVLLREGRFAGISLTPDMRAGAVHLDVAALLAMKKKLPEATCDEVRRWRSEDGGSYDAKENTSLLLSGLGRIGLPVLKVRVLPAGGPPPGGFRHDSMMAFCGCEYPSPRNISDPDTGMASGVAGAIYYPQPGKCAQITGCGQCCRAAARTRVSPDHAK